MLKHWYAWFNSYGCIATTSFGGGGGGQDNGYVYLAFPTKEARDGWLFTHKYAGDGLVVAGAITRKEIEKDIGAFYICKSVCLHKCKNNWYAEDWANDMYKFLMDGEMKIYTE